MKITPRTQLTFPCGKIMKNRFMLAPLTNTQSHENGKLSKEELDWLCMRAKGDFGMIMTCASHVSEQGKGFPRQLGIFSDELMDGHKKLVKSLHKYESLAVIQLQHAGMRSPEYLLNTQPVCPSDNEEYHARGLSYDEVIQLREDFVAAAIRAKNCGYDGVEVHGAHGYILTQFLSATINKRTDEYGGALENRARLLFEIVQQIREACGADFLLGVRLSPERFGMDVNEIKWVCEQLVDTHWIDFLDISLWDCFRVPEDTQYQDKTLLEHFSTIDYKQVKYTVAGKIYTAQDVQRILDAGVDFVGIGRSGILHHDFPRQVIRDANFEPIKTPVNDAYLRTQGLSDHFIEYLRKWPDLIQ